MTGIYLQPIGYLYGEVARDAVSLGAALPLAGSSIAFCAIRLWEGEPGTVKHAIVRTSTIQAIDEPRVKELLDRLVAPRAAIAGVSMDTPRVMGIVNVTPDSFSDGGDHFEPARQSSMPRHFPILAQTLSILAANRRDLGLSRFQRRRNCGASCRFFPD